jgi:lipoyl-dependent peroxiredoxin
METAVEKKVVYTAKVKTTGGRISGHAKSDDGRLEVRLSIPGTSGLGTNPEQLFGAAWTACFEGGMQMAARAMHVRLPDDTAINAEIDLMQADESFSIKARLYVSIPGVDRETAQKIVDLGHQSCVYSKAIRGNVDTVITLVD